MSTISSTTSATNPYAVAYSTNDLSGSDSTASKYSTSTSSSKSGSSSTSGSYSEGLVSQMSGIDVNSMVNESMASDVIKLNSLLAQQQQSQWTQDRYRSIITNMQNFSSNYFDVLSNNYILSSSGYSAYTAASTTASVATASASNDVTQGTYTLNVGSLATAAQLTNSPTLTNSSNPISNSATLSQVLGNISGAPTSGTISFTVNGTQVSYDLGANQNKTLSQVMNDLSNLSGNATFKYSELTKNFSIQDKTTGTGNTLTIDTTNTISDPTQNANTESNTQSFLNALFGMGVSSSTTSQIIGSTKGTAGTNGSFTLTEPGGTATAVPDSSSNNFTIDGVTYNVTATGTTSINVSQDVSSVVNKIQNFVNDYNNLIDGINSVTTEKKDYSYKPLTSSQESQMTATQITAWNQKAQQGLLANDGNLTDMLSAMRQAFYTPVNGNNLTMASVGLSTSDDPSQGGKLTLDVKALTKALQNNPQQVVNLFTQTSTTYPTYSGALGVDTSTNSSAVSQAVNQRSSEEGIFQRLSDISQKYAGTYVDKNGNQGILLMEAGMPNTLSETKNILYQQLKDQANAVSDFKDKMTNDAKMYNQKFSALQSALSQLSSQQNYFSSMLGSSS
ncbi:flagellar filament capping protein FliD [Clostridium hydrogenum]|uniref:flagellar filament capping protein FliD n=1 Tax=Clostridium hydrogenum TaxID=2855764 RepID=UPI001F16E5D3|nr:flagellar filament capping protein FliD [Clostridium hydrogenum]